MKVIARPAEKKNALEEIIREREVYFKKVQLQIDCIVELDINPKKGKILNEIR
jgi:hypothetical protein